MTQQPPHEPDALNIDLTDSQATLSAPESSDSAVGIEADRGPHDRTPERRCVLSRQSFPKEQLIRCVQGPESLLAIDFAGKLPGRGVWFQPDRTLIETAQTQKKLQPALSRGLKAAVQLPQDNLLDILAEGIARRCLQRLGLENRAGHVVSGSDKIRSAGAAKMDMLLVASDAAEDGLRKIIASAHKKTRICQLFDREALSRTLGKDNAVHVLITAGRGTEFLSAEIAKLAGVLGVDAYLPDRNFGATDREDDE